MPYMYGMTKHPRRPRDPNQLARMIVDLATDAAVEETLPELTPAGELGKLGGAARAQNDRCRKDGIRTQGRGGALEQQTFVTHISRFTRLTNGFSKKVENHTHAVALHFMAYNFVRTHGSLRVTPAMAAGVTNRLWDIADIVQVMEEWEERQSR